MTEEVLVRATRSFEDWAQDDQAVLPRKQIQALLDNGFFEVLAEVEPDVEHVEEKKVQRGKAATGPGGDPQVSG